ncbi:VOC family protein [Streptomyces sp. HNM0663]|uniref:VOC family protein n=1 Tax=Streptomyces chengmaiensis TaxID=3040919 RepID=A0ABT6HZA3_9ACTN|nr:VOC family protein [Streptomyces chengmaiensis]MDH2394042.1 VOC family protein [Streptomyces chengmaiensis]
MAALPEGAPCWADAAFPDLEAAKNFYAELFGWTYTDALAQFGGYTQALKDGRPVAAVETMRPGLGGEPSWNLYFATSDIEATTAKIRDSGGALLMDPMKVGEYGTMVTAEDPSGAYFSAWQPASHEGFGRTGEPGAYCWAEVTARDAAKADAFYPAVFPLEVRPLGDARGGEGGPADFHVWKVQGRPVAGRHHMTDDFPPDVHPFINVYFGVADCDAAVETVRRLGGQVLQGHEPTDSPFGRYATVKDPQGAVFSVIDTATTVGEPPDLS